MKPYEEVEAKFGAAWTGLSIVICAIVLAIVIVWISRFKENETIQIFEYKEMTEARFYTRECVQNGGRIKVRELPYIGIEVTCTGAKNE